jgi:UDP-N-acetylmuramoyl-tripeptide--D-alanyl-D-alanine ligase
MTLRYKLKELSAIMRTPVGRLRFLLGVGYRLWPALSYLTMLYRRIFIPRKRVIAVVGSFGKSTTMRTINAALGNPSAGNRDLNSYSMVALNLIASRPRDRYAVIEVGIDGKGQMDRYAWMLRPDVAVVTSIGSEHNRSLKSLEVTRQEKSEMAKALPGSGTAVLNGDDPNVVWMMPGIRARIFKFGLAESNDIRASDIHLDWPRGTAFKLHINGQTHDMKIRLLGKNGVYAILAAIAVAVSEGVAIEIILSRIQKVPPTPGRLEPIELGNGAIFLRDDFKSSLETIDAALDILEEIPAGRKIVVMGEVSEPPGSQGPIYGKIGERVAGIASKAVFVGCNFQRYAAGAFRGGFSKNNIIKAGRDVLYTAELIKNELKPGDVVLVKGRTDQRLERISLLFTGRKVLCNIISCKAAIRCDTCPMLEKGWSGLKVVI